MESYKRRFSTALQSEHDSLFDADNGNLSNNYKEDLKGCPVCKCQNSSIYCVKDKFVHKECKEFGLIYLDPKLNREATLKFYNSPVNEIYNEQ